MSEDQIKRNMDDLHTNAEMFAPLEREGVFLNNFDTVNTMVRGFLSEVVKAHGQAMAHEITREELQKRVGDLIAPMPDIFLGRNPEYVTTVWNTPGQIGEHLRNTLEVEGTPEELVTLAFARAVTDTLQIMAANRERTDDGWMWELDAPPEYLTNVLLGLDIGSVD